MRGSEYSVGWNHVTNMASHCDLTVLYGLAGPHMGDLEEIEDFLAENGQIPGVTFEPIRPNRWAQLLNAPNRNGFWVYSFYLAYRAWHRQAAARARDIVAEREVDLIHYLCPIGYREPGYLWKLDKPYIWGPVGGMIPTRRLAGAPRGWKDDLKVRLKNALNALQLRSSARVGKALRRADTVIAATSENQAVLQDRFGVRALQFAENAIPDTWLASGEQRPAVDHDRAEGGALRLIWIGSLEARKAPDLLIDALSRLISTAWHLDIVGSGPLDGVAQDMVRDRGLETQIRFHGQIPRDQVQALLGRADTHLITSMSEGNPTTLWETMAAGVPTITLDHNGMHDVVCPSCGIRVPLGTWDQTCDAFAAAIMTLIEAPDRLAALKRGTCACREGYRWSRRAEDWMRIYRDTMARYGRS
ncbi:glycosyltransferase family 4 protein [Tropicimonas sp. TH_r6]|uniref:glycosyltransferase family 4 protein n=1 Tax=Tropicimonas sp. TH_r6 TaxID=3082085 RepID=UPI002954064E|nr:glycosyltransferase family 4 protein [Tropicimonas sp. TH_r6]MDV7144372.1 glycosyltransferase family 4 protein [Tropicimonas sp. TH_r6]